VPITNHPLLQNMIRLQPFRASFPPLYRGSLYYLAFWGGVGVYMPFINVYFVQLGLSGRQIGLLAMLFPLMTLLFAMPLSALADRRRWRIPILKSALLAFALTFFLLGRPTTFTALVPLMLLLALFFSPIISVSDTLIAGMAARHRLNYGAMRMWGSFAFASMAVVCGILWQRLGFSLMFTATSLLFIPVIWFAHLLEEEPLALSLVDRPLREIGRDPGLLVLLAAGFLVGIAMGMAVIFEGVYMARLGGGQFLVGMLFAAAAFSELPTMQYSGLITRYISGAKTLLLAYFLMSSAYAAYSLAWTPAALLVMGAVKGLGFGLFYVSTVRLVNARAPREWSATVQSMLTAGMFGLAPLLAAPLAGTLYDVIGPAAVFVSASMAVALAALVVMAAAVRGWLE
jgi:MFS transporter, PPP family, 3-phenylpropionic acid transporter